MQFEYASKTENLLSRIPCSGYFFIKNVTHNKALVFSFLSDEIGWSTIGYYILSLFNYGEFILQTAVLFAICNIINNNNNNKNNNIYTYNIYIFI